MKIDSGATPASPAIRYSRRCGGSAAPAYAYLRDKQAPAIGLYGAIELRNVHGPLLAAKTYRSGGTLLHAGETPKTEYVWFDS